MGIDLQKDGVIEIKDAAIKAGNGILQIPVASYVVDFGTITMHLESILKDKGISKNQVCRDLNIPRTNFNRYCRNNFERIDSYLLCKLCWYLDIDIGVGELLEYKRPE